MPLENGQHWQEAPGNVQGLHFTGSWNGIILKAQQICLVLFPKKVASGVVLVLAKCCLKAHRFLHKRNRLELEVHCGNTDRP